MESDSFMQHRDKHVQHHLYTASVLQMHGTICLLKFHSATVHLFLKITKAIFLF